jgi:NADH-quinone oxidoreductase subunit C
MSNNATEEFKNYLLAEQPKAVEDVVLTKSEIIILAHAEKNTDLLHFLKTDAKCEFQQLIALTAADYPADQNRFEVVYCLLSLTHNRRVIVKIRTSEAIPVQSAVGIYSAAGWYEREVWDMYGIKFRGHPDLKRILMYEEFDGHPLRKDYPVQGKQPRIPLRAPEVRNTALDMQRPALVSINPRKSAPSQL